MPVACFPAVGESMERRLRLKRAVDKFHFFLLSMYLEAPQNAFDPDLTQTGKISGMLILVACSNGHISIQYRRLLKERKYFSCLAKI